MDSGTRVVVVGASRGIGQALVRAFVARGCKVAALARNEVGLRALQTELGRDAVVPVRHDVTQLDQVEAAFRTCVERLGGVDVLVYSAGVMPAVELDEFDTAKDTHIFQVNTLGAMAWLNAGASYMGPLHRGVLVGIGSVAGDRGRLGNPAYCASKAALHSFLESLRNRLDRHGVRVVTIKPGPVKTDMTKDRGALPLLIEADAAAAQIVDAVRRPVQVRYVPWLWRPIMLAVRSIPSVVFRRMNF